MILQAVSAVSCGLGRRIAGGVLNQWFSPPGGRVFGDYPARAIWAGSIVGAAATHGLHHWWHAPILGVGVFLGCSVGHRFNLGRFGQLGGIDLGREGKVSYWRAFLGLELHGLGQFGLMALAMLLLGYGWWWAPLVAALLCSPAYEAGWRLSPNATGNPRFPLGLRGGSELGELIWGVLAGLAVAFL